MAHSHSRSGGAGSSRDSSTGPADVSEQSALSEDDLLPADMPTEVGDIVGVGSLVVFFAQKYAQQWQDLTAAVQYLSEEDAEESRRLILDYEDVRTKEQTPEPDLFSRVEAPVPPAKSVVVDLAASLVRQSGMLCMFLPDITWYILFRKYMHATGCLPVLTIIEDCALYRAIQGPISRLRWCVAPAEAVSVSRLPAPVMLSPSRSARIACPCSHDPFADEIRSLACPSAAACNKSALQRGSLPCHARATRVPIVCVRARLSCGMPPRGALFMRPAFRARFRLRSVALDRRAQKSPAARFLHARQPAADQPQQLSARAY